MANLINTLPIETLAYVFSFLTYDLRSLGRCEQVCRLWKVVIGNHAWSQVYHHRWPELGSETIAGFPYKTRTLWLSGIKGLSLLSNSDWERVTALSVKSHLLAVGGVLCQWLGDGKGGITGVHLQEAVVIYDWTQENGQILNTLPLDLDNEIKSLQFVDEKKLITNTVDGLCHIWDWPQKQCLTSFPIYGPPTLDRVDMISHIDCNEGIWTFSCDTFSALPIKARYLPEGNPSFFFENELEKTNQTDRVFVTCMTFLFSNNLFVCGKRCHNADDSSVEYWIYTQHLMIEESHIRCVPDEPFQILSGHANNISCFAYQEKDELLASGDTAGLVYIWNLFSGKFLKTIRQQNPSQTVTHMAFYHNNLIVSGSETQVLNQSFLEIWDISTGNLLSQFPGKSVPCMPIQVLGGCVIFPQLNVPYTINPSNEPYFPNRIAIVDVNEIKEKDDREPPHKRQRQDFSVLITK